MAKKQYLECSTTECDVGPSFSKLSFLVKIIKCSVFLICLVGFSYQTVEFIQHFRKHPTVVTIEIKSPGKIVLPALTFCNTNPVQRSAYCSKYPDNCEKPDDMEAFCKNRPHYCTGSNMSDFLIPKMQYIYPDDPPNGILTNQDIVELSQNSSSLLPWWINERNEKVPTPVFFYEWPNLGRIHQCFTDNYLRENISEPHFITIPNNQDANYVTFVAMYNFNLEADEMFDPDAEPGLLFSIHSPYETINPYFKGTFLKPGNNIKIAMRLEEQNFLPYPYDSDCIDYEELWKRNNTRPRSRKACSERCVDDFYLSCHGCLFNSHTMTLSNINTVCNLSYIAENFCDDEVLDKRLNDCEKSCKKDCRRLLYPCTIEENVGQPHVDKNNSKYIAIKIFVPNSEVILLSHRPQYEDVELFSYIGGFMGYWMGISVWALSDIFGHVIAVTVNFFKKFKSQNML